MRRGWYALLVRSPPGYNASNTMMEMSTRAFRNSEPCGVRVRPEERPVNGPPECRPEVQYGCRWPR